MSLRGKFNLVFCLLAVILFRAPDRARAQRNIDPPRPHRTCSEYECAPIDHVPPLKSDMSLDCIRGYISFDSLARLNLSFNQVDSLSNRITSLDTIKPFLRMLYAMTDYDPVLFDEYAYWGNDVTNSYKINPSWFLMDFAIREDSVLGRLSKIRFLCNSGLILHVKVLDMHRDTAPDANSLPLNCYSAAILDTIKGKNFPSGFPMPRQKSNGVTSQEAKSIIGFVISSRWQRYGEVSDVEPTSNLFNDSAMTVGCEYILFLNTEKENYDGHHVYRDYWPATHYSPEAGIFRIDGNGNVLIPSNFFGYGTSVPLSTFLADIRSDIRAILR